MEKLLSSILKAARWHKKFADETHSNNKQNIMRSYYNLMSLFYDIIYNANHYKIIPPKTTPWQHFQNRLNNDPNPN